MEYFGKDKGINLLSADTEKVFRGLVENLRIGVYMADRKGDLFYVNSSFVNILGYQSKDEVLGLNLAKQLYVDSCDREVFLKKMEQFGFVRDYEIRNKCKDGSVITLSVTSNYIRNEREEVVGVQGVVHDVSDQKQLEANKKILNSAIEQAADHIMITNKKGIISYVNPSFEKTTGYLQEEVLGKNPNILQSGEHQKDYYESLWKTILAGKTFSAQTTNKKKSGELYVTGQTISPIKDESGEITHFVSIGEDITQRLKLEEQLRIEKQKLEEIVGFDEKVSKIKKPDQLIDFIVEKTSKILQADKCVLMFVDHANGDLCLKAAKGLDHQQMKETQVKLGDPFAGMVAKSEKAVLVKDSRSESNYQQIQQLHYLGGSFIIVPIKLDDKLFGVISVANNSSKKPFNEVDLKILNIISREVAVAIENVQLYKRLKFLAYIDPITQLYNHRQFSSSLANEISRASRYGRNLSLIMIDIDDFKSYNDEFGHLEGDQLLRSIGELFKKYTRDVDIACRYAGDEFAIILPETDIEGAKKVAKKIKRIVEDFSFKQTVTLSIGIARFSPKMTRHDLILKTDQALYQAKQEGKNRICYFN